MDKQEWIDLKTKDLFFGMPNFYRSSDGVVRFTNIDDYSDSLTQNEWILIARALRDGDHHLAGTILANSLNRVCAKLADEAYDDEMGE